MFPSNYYQLKPVLKPVWAVTSVRTEDTPKFEGSYIMFCPEGPFVSLTGKAKIGAPTGCPLTASCFSLYLSLSENSDLPERGWRSLLPTTTNLIRDLHGISGPS